MKKTKSNVILISILLMISIPVLSDSYNLTVNAGQEEGTWNRFYEMCVSSCHTYTVLDTAFGRNIQNSLKRGHDEAGFKYIRFHGILNADVGVYTEVDGNPVYNWTNFDQIYDAIKDAGMRPILEISFTPPDLASGDQAIHWYNEVPANITMPKDWNKWMALMSELVLHCEERYGVEEVRNNWYFEVWNEPDWMLEGGMSPSYLTLYEYTVQGIVAADPLVKVGGPAQSGPSSTFSIPLLIEHCNENNLKLDFITYHRYANDTDYGGSFANANSMHKFHRAIVELINEYGFTGELINTEWGPTYSTDSHRDNEIAASFIAKTIHLIGTDTVPPPVMFGYWTISDLYEEYNTGTTAAFHNGLYGLMLKGDPRNPVSYDLEKAAFNSFKLLHKMGDVRLSSSGGTTGDGVNLAATISSDYNQIQILIYSHINGTSGNSSNTDTISLTVNNIPFAPGQVTVGHYLVDRNHSNAYHTWIDMGNPSHPTEEQWNTLKAAAELAYRDPIETVNLSGSGFSKSFTQNTYSVGLIILSGSGAEPPTPTPPPDGTCGDVNNSGAINIVDALLIAQFYVGLDVAEFNEAYADANGDGTINVLDALLVARYYVGLITDLSCNL